MYKFKTFQKPFSQEYILHKTLVITLPFIKIFPSKIFEIGIFLFFFNEIKKLVFFVFFQKSLQD